ncbi:SRPBCC family protein [Paraburkholderia sp. J67]|uniref:SRPBCC family protein n=1 Tax=Paraburkholderia sp. J67 TaxID=2805435 RepID=UPI002ABDA2A9|nr:SRPBCC family protein [Paraburkholderia sp. J67]
MASLYREIPLASDAARAWATLRDSRNIARVFAGVLTDVQVEGDMRNVTFANGNVVQERIVTVDDARMRVAYTVCGPNFEQHAASMQIVADEADEQGERCRLLWVCDFLPDERRALVEPLMDAGCAAAARSLSIERG